MGRSPKDQQEESAVCYDLCMLLLAADTSGKHGSIALARCNPEADCVPLEVVPLAGGTFSAQLVPQIADLLSRHGFSKSDLGGFAVASGPGSFTGLRVGLAAIKALAEVLRKPVATVSLLEAVAASSRVTGKVIAALDAGRGEVYVGEYAVLQTPVRVAEQLLRKDEFLSAVAHQTLVTPDRNLAELGGHAAARVIEVIRPQSGLIARLGWPKIRGGQTISPEDLEANYIRRSDAEIFSKSGL
jgi:tRNA threonylcarbamoyladenosine biosynthesis protein TsaB